MRKRTKAREYALQVLYQMDIRRASCTQILQEFWDAHQAPAEIKAYASEIAEGTATHLSEVDGFITTHADNWDLKRMAVVDRNILRLGVFELMHRADVPPTVCINEAIELAKRFGDTESAKFVNGVLDAIHKAAAKKAASPTGSITPADSPSH